MHLTAFTSLHALFKRLPADLPLTDAKAKDALGKLLFEPTYEGLPEAMRMKRAEALVVIANVQSCRWVVERLGAEVEGGERSPVVRGVLTKVGKE